MIPHDRLNLVQQILRATRDGEELDPSDLYVVELAANGHLSQQGEIRFSQILETTLKGEYTKPWFHGVEHMTRDHEGYVYYKGIHVDHYSGSLIHSPRGRVALVEMKARCEALEAANIRVNTSNTVWCWEGDPNILWAD